MSLATLVNMKINGKNRKKSAEALAGRSYVLCDTEEKLIACEKVLLKQDILAVDIETNSTLDPFLPKATIWTISFGYAKGKAFCIALDHPSNTNIDVYDKGKILIAKILKTKIKKVFHNCVFDVKWLRKFGYVINGVVVDTMIMAYLLNEHRASNGLKELAEDILDGYVCGFTENLQDLADYNSEDTDYALQLFNIFSKQLSKFPKLDNLFYKVIMPFCNVIVDMELTGILIDKLYAAKLRDTYQKNVDKLNTAMGEDFPITKHTNMGSSQQLSDLLFNKMKYQPVKTTKTGFSVDHSVLVTLAETQKCTLARYLVKVRTLEKALSTYVIKIPKMVDSDDRLRGGFNIVGTRTGRLCVSPETLIEMPRNLEKFPNGIPLRLVKSGDWVYSFDWMGRLCLKQVKWVGVTKVDETINVKIIDRRTQKVTSLVCTPDHLVRLNNGKWQAAGKLKSGDALMGMVRRGYDAGYSFFFPSARRKNPRNSNSVTGGRVREHRWVYAQTQGLYNLPSKWDIHHKDLNKLNNEISNFDFCLHSNHMKMHYKARTKDEVKYILMNPSVWEFSAEALYRCAFKVGIKKPKKFFKELLATNHNVVSVTPGIIQEVWDLEVEDTHTFIGADVALHNSSQKPNLQNIPRDKKIKKMFVVPEGYKLLNIDASQAELRIASSIANEPTMIRAYNDGEDIHTLTASKVLGKSMADITKNDRQKAKGVNFGFIYGASAQGFMYYAEGTYGLKLSLKECEVFRHKYFSVYPGFLSWYDRTKVALRKNGYIEYPTGRFARFPIVKGVVDIPNDILRKAVNYPVQGSSSDIILFIMVCLTRFLRRSKIDAKIIITVHDSIVLEVKEGYDQDIVAEVDNIAQYDVPKFFPWLKVPMLFDSAIGASWGDLEE